jgi:hypothetical protein
MHWVLRGPFAIVPRKMRVEFSGAICHVMRRGDRRNDASFTMRIGAVS